MYRYRRIALLVVVLLGFGTMFRLVVAGTVGRTVALLPMVIVPAPIATTATASPTITQTVPPGSIATATATATQTVPPGSTATATQTVSPGSTATATATQTATATATQTVSPGSTATATATQTATSQPTATRTPTITPTTSATGSQISVGAGYTDTSPKQLVRTSANRLYIAASDCESYPCTDASQTLRMYRANATGVPTSFTRPDSGNEPDGVAGWAIAIDNNNLIHVAWTARNADGDTINSLNYAIFNTSNDSWGATETIESFTFNLGGQGKESVALALDASGNPHVVYLKGTGNTDRHIYYRNRVGGSWSGATQLDSTISYGNNQQAWHPNLAFDPDGLLLAMWQRGSFNDVADGTIFSRVRATNGTWGSAVNVSGDNGSLTSIDTSLAIVITPDGTYHTSYLHGNTNNAMKYIRYRYSTNQGASWQANNPGGGTQASHNPALGYANGKLRIYGHGTPDAGNHGDNLYYFEGNGGSASWGGWTQLIAGTNIDSSVNTRWSQFFYHSQNTIDVAYWNDVYPNQLFVWVK
jgi:hypothetical protein